MAPPARAAVLVRLLILPLTARTGTPSSFCSDDPHWATTWSDDFSTTTLDPSSWARHVGSGDSLERLSTATPENVYLQDGQLVLRSRREAANVSIAGKAYNFSTGAVTSQGKRSFRPPMRVCVRATLPGGGGGPRCACRQPGCSFELSPAELASCPGKGIWPAHWLMPDHAVGTPGRCSADGSSEIDILEMLNGDGVMHSTYHTYHTPCGGPSNAAKSGYIYLGDDWDTTPHEFAVEVGHDSVAFALDGAVFLNISNTSARTFGRGLFANGTHTYSPASTPSPFQDVPYYIILNTAVGFFPGVDNNPNATTKLPVYHKIDYVKVARPAPLKDDDEDNFICARNYGPDSVYPLPCRPARDHWQSPLQDTFVITAWGGPDLTYFANGTSKEAFHKEGGVREYAEAGFNLLTGDCNIGCDQPMVNASGPRGSAAAAFDCLARAALDVEAHGLKLAFHPTDVNGIQNDQGVEYPPYEKWTTVNNTYDRYVLGGVEGMGGVSDSGPGSWSLTTPEVRWVVRELERRNLSHIVAQIFFHDDEIGDSAATANSVRWLREHHPTITPQANTFSDSAPESLYRDGQFLFAPEQYAVIGGPGPGMNLTSSKAEANQMAMQELIMFANDQVLTERYRLDYWPLFAVGDGGDVFDLISDSLIRVQAYSAVAYGARGLYWYCYNGAIWNVTTADRKTLLPPSVNYHPLSNYKTVQGTNRDLLKWGTSLLSSRHVGAVRRPSDSRNDHSVSPGPGRPVQAMDDELLVGVFSDGLKDDSGWLMVVNLQTAMSPGVIVARNVSLRMHPACSAAAVSGGAGGWFGRHHHQRNATHAGSQRITVELDAGAGALLRVTPNAAADSGDSSCGVVLRAVRQWWYSPRTINLRHSWPETSLKAATYGGSSWMPQEENLGNGAAMDRDATDQAYGRGWCNQRPCLPGRSRFFHSPGGLAGDTSSFIIGGSHERNPWSTDGEAQAWAEAAFLVAAVPTAKGGDALALTLAHATAHGMFVLAAPAGNDTIMAPASLLRVAEDTSCHTNFGGFVLGTATTADSSAIVRSADAMRSVAYWALPLVLGVPSVAAAAALGDSGVPFPAIALPPITTTQSAHSFAQAVVDVLAPIGAAAANHSVRMTPAVELSACSSFTRGSDSLLRFSAYSALLLGAQALWWSNLTACAPLGSERFDTVRGINRRVAQWAEPLFMRREYFLQSSWAGCGDGMCPQPQVPHRRLGDGHDGAGKKRFNFAVPPFGPTDFVIDSFWSTSSLKLPALRGANGTLVHALAPGGSSSAVVQAMDKELVVVHFHNATADGGKDTGFCKSQATVQGQDCISYDNVLWVLSTDLSLAADKDSPRQLNVSLRSDVWTSHPIVPNAFEGFTTDCNLNWLGPFVPLRLRGGAAQVVSFTLGPGPVIGADGQAEAGITRGGRRVSRRKPAPWRPPPQRATPGKSDDCQAGAL